MKKHAITDVNFKIESLVCALLVLIALNAFSLNLGYMSSLMSKILGLIALAPMIIYLVSIYKKLSINKSFLIGLLLIAVAFLCLFSSQRPEIWVISVAILISGLDLILRSAKIIINDLSAISFGCILYSIIFTIFLYISDIWLKIGDLSFGLSRFAGWVTGAPLNIGPTITNIAAVLSCLCLMLAFFILSEEKNSVRPIKSFLISASAVIIIFFVYLIILSGSKITGEILINSIYLVLLLTTIPLILFIYRVRISPIKSITLAQKKADLLFLAILFVFFVALLTQPYEYSKLPGKVVLYERDTDMGFDLPQFPKANEFFEPYRGYSVGSLALLLRAAGYDLVELNDSNSQTLDQSLVDSDLLILLNLKKPFSSEDRNTILNFLKNGGGLLVFGEHTRMFISDEDFNQGKDYLNDLVGPAGITVNPDTADYTKGRWLFANLPLPHPMTRSLGLQVSTSSVGASLNLSNGSCPLIIGRYAFSDDPNPKSPGHLGDRRYNKKERMGDLVLGAYSTYGKGRVLVLGDTAYIFNTEVPFRHQFLRDSVSWLTGRNSDNLVYLRLIAILLSGALLVIFIGARSIRPRYSLHLQIGAAFVVLLSILLSGAANNYWLENSQPDIFDNGVNIAAIDYAHLNEIDSSNYSPGSIDGLLINLMRNNYIPLFFKEKEDFARISSDNIILLLAPNQDYSSKESSNLNEFVDQGGLLIISAGYRNSGPLKRVLDSFGLYINETPLGSVPWIADTHGTGGKLKVSDENLQRWWHKPKFMEAHPVGASGNFEPLYWLEYEGVRYNLIVAKKYGQGHVIMIGDSRFLLNENLEYLLSKGTKQEQYELQWLGNIEFLKEIISKYAGGRL